MKATFKPLGIAAAVAAASAAYTGQVSASEIDAGDLGDLAIIPYYTTQQGYVTGVHITNTSGYTQVVKLRLRRGSDSMDSLDFNLILSPYDMWTGTVKKDGDSIIFRTGDSSCTAPGPNHPEGFEMPDPSFDTLIDFRDGAEEGYIEVIGMAQAGPNEPISIAAKHPNMGGSLEEQPVPLDCDKVRSNFFRNATLAVVPWVGDGSDVKGITSSATSNQDWYQTSDPLNKGTSYILNNGEKIAAIARNDYMETDNVLAVSYFIRDGDSGLEMGSKAVHIQDFSDHAMMSNQVGYDVAIPDAFAYFYPDLDGGSPIDTPRNLFDGNVRPALGVDSVLNDWSVNAALNVGTDWVVTLPGQYLMVHRDKYWTHIASEQEDGTFAVPCNPTNTPASGDTPEDTSCDFRDIPVVANIALWDREEQETIITTPEDELVVSPSVGLDPETPAILLEYEVNVIKWFGPDTEGEDGVLGSQYAGFIDVGTLGNSGWAQLAISPSPSKTQRVCVNQQLPFLVNGTPVSQAQVDAACIPVVNTAVPMVGFVSWKRSFPDRPDGNYGRIIDHSWVEGSSST